LEVQKREDDFKLKDGEEGRVSQCLVSSLVVHIWLIPFLELQVAGQKTFQKTKNFPKLLNLQGRQMSTEPAGPLFHGHFLKVSQGWIKISEIHRFGYETL